MEEEIFATGEPHTFEEWLKAFSETDISVEEIKSEQEDLQETEEEELDQIIQQGGASDYLHKLVEEETHYSKGLEEYIKEQVQKRKKPERVALLNENEIDPDIVTETMAKVYEMQKKYSRAIRAYEMLILKYPEKSDLFAARINYLKNIF
ncbi:MAG: hypothetical protein IPP77_01040 [Bacteroidetes bacterium]|nr:hypothetical protein [Bacteroidota bacterium]